LVGKPQSNNWPDIYWGKILKYISQINFGMRNLLNFFTTRFNGWFFKNRNKFPPFTKHGIPKLNLGRPICMNICTIDYIFVIKTSILKQRCILLRLEGFFFKKINFYFVSQNLKTRFAIKPEPQT